MKILKSPTNVDIDFISIIGIIVILFILLCSFAPNQRSEPMVQLESKETRDSVNLKLKKDVEKALKQTKIKLDSLIRIHENEYSGTCKTCHKPTK